MDEIIDLNVHSSGIGSHDDEDLLMSEVVGEDHELLFLDTFLKDLFKQD